MDTDNRLIAYITYVGSQLTYCYEDPRNYKIPISDMNPLTHDEWYDAVKECYARLTGRWLGVYRALYGNQPARLASACAEHFTSLAAARGRCVLYHDPRYPPRLRDIKDPPFAINALGSCEQMSHAKTTAIIGSRRATPYALQQAYDIARFLHTSGTCIVSGGAYGCDIAAHHGVLATCIQPFAAIAVMAGGLQKFYPTRNAPVLDDLAAGGGVVISERLWHQPARAFDFPVRNRIIAGISDSVLIMQAGVKSGAMLTANRALDYGRDVYVLLHPIGGEAFDGNQRLLLDGALGFDGLESYRQRQFFGLRMVEPG